MRARFFAMVYWTESNRGQMAKVNPFCFIVRVFRLNSVAFFFGNFCESLYPWITFAEVVFQIIIFLLAYLSEAIWIRSTTKKIAKFHAYLLI